MTKLILGEFRRSIDERYRVSVPPELMAGLSVEPREEEGLPPAEASPGWVLAKERPGCISLWQSEHWEAQLASGIRVVESKLAAGRLGDRLSQVQTLGRLLSTRHRPVSLAGRGRLVIPEGFREFLGAEPGSEVLMVGAAVCIEIWRPDAWIACLNAEIPSFGQILDELSR
jgi:MraZ protein